MDPDCLTKISFQDVTIDGDDLLDALQTFTNLETINFYSVRFDHQS